MLATPNPSPTAPFLAVFEIAQEGIEYPVHLDLLGVLRQGLLFPDLEYLSPAHSLDASASVRFITKSEAGLLTIRVVLAPLD
jgi:hypothetical protein